MKIAVASGKGGTGKTFVAVNLAFSFSRCVDLIDCDVETPNCILYFNKNHKTREVGINTLFPSIDEEKCIYCGACKYCKFNAITIVNKKLLFFPELCRSCGLCNFLCPTGAITERKKNIGTITFLSKFNINLKSGKINVDEYYSGNMINAVKNCKPHNHIEILDCPPGTGLSFMECITGVDYCIIVAEENRFSLSDIKRLIKGINKTNVPYGIVINKYFNKINLITKFCTENNINLLGQIPYKKEINEYISNNKIIINNDDSLFKIFKNIKRKINI